MGQDQGIHSDVIVHIARFREHALGLLPSSGFDLLWQAFSVHHEPDRVPTFWTDRPMKAIARLVSQRRADG